MTLRKTSLSRRGVELASGDSLRDMFKTILSDPYDPDTNTEGFVNIGTAENYCMLDEVSEFVSKHFELQPRNFSYGEGPWGSARLRKAMARHVNRNFHPLTPIDAEDILFANGVTALCEILGFTIADPGDGVLFTRPIYGAFQMDFGLKAKVKPVFIDFDDVDQFAPDAVEKYEEAIVAAENSGTHIRAIMLCNPHNPLGQCYPEATVIQVLRLCSKYHIHLLVDEIYALSVYDIADEHAVPFASILTLDYEKYISEDLVHVLYGMSKDMAAGGLRLGCFITRNKELMRAMSAITQFHWSGAANEKAAILMLEDEKWMDAFLHRSRTKLAARNKLTRRILEDAGIEYHRGANAGFFLWIDLRPYLPKLKDGDNPVKAEQVLSKKLMDNKVFITPGASLSAAEPGFFRVIFSQDERVIREGMRRVLEVCQGKSESNARLSIDDKGAQV